MRTSQVAFTGRLINSGQLMPQDPAIINELSKAAEKLGDNTDLLVVGKMIVPVHNQTTKMVTEGKSAYLTLDAGLETIKTQIAEFLEKNT